METRCDIPLSVGVERDVANFASGYCSNSLKLCIRITQDLYIILLSNSLFHFSEKLTSIRLCLYYSSKTNSVRFTDDIHSVAKFISEFQSPLQATYNSIWQFLTPSSLIHLVPLPYFQHTIISWTSYCLTGHSFLVSYAVSPPPPSF